MWGDMCHIARPNDQEKPTLGQGEGGSGSGEGAGLYLQHELPAVGRGALLEGGGLGQHVFLQVGQRQLAQAVRVSAPHPVRDAAHNRGYECGSRIG